MCTQLEGMANNQTTALQASRMDQTGSRRINKSEAGILNRAALTLNRATLTLNCVALILAGAAVILVGAAVILVGVAGELVGAAGMLVGWSASFNQIHTRKEAL